MTLSRNSGSLDKLITLSATLLVVSLGLCGATAIVGVKFAAMDRFLDSLGILELIGGCLGIFGLIVAGIWKIVLELKGDKE